MLVRLTRKTLCGVALAVSAVVLATGCGGGGGKKAASSTTSASSSVTAMGPRPSETRATIRQNWETFFDSSTSSATRVSLLQNGSRFAKTIAALGASPIAQHASVKVTSVALDSPSSATVTFDVLVGGNAVAHGLKGKAVLVDGGWKVGLASLCRLATLIGLSPQGCPGK